MTNLPDISILINKMGTELANLLTQNAIHEPYLVGIQTGGYWIAERLHQQLKLSGPLGSLDISFYRDDFTTSGLNPTVKPSTLPVPTDNRHIILVDDVIMSGRTIRAALNELFDFGRPASIILVSLIDVGGRKLPIQPDICGEQLSLANNLHIKLNGPEPLTLVIKELTEK